MSYIVSADVVSTVLDGEAVLLDMGSGQYYTLDPVATRAWRVVEQGGVVGAEQLIDVLLGEYDVTRPVLASDVEVLLDDLVTRRLLCRSDP